jgi:hypothetical protein
MERGGACGGAQQRRRHGGRQSFMFLSLSGPTRKGMGENLVKSADKWGLQGQIVGGLCFLDSKWADWWSISYLADGKGVSRTLDGPRMILTPSLSLLLIKTQTLLENKISAVHTTSSDDPQSFVLPSPFPLKSRWCLCPARPHQHALISHIHTSSHNPRPREEH